MSSYRPILDTSIGRATPRLEPPRIREASFDDYPQIAAILDRNGLATKPFNEWSGVWRGNPVAGDRQWPIGWVLETGGGKLVGTIGSVPGAYRFRGRDLISAAAGDWAVDEIYRRYSLMLLDVFTKQKRVDLLICTTVSPASEPAYPAFKWSKAPAGTWDCADFWITNYRQFSRAACKVKGLPFSHWMSYPVSAALFFLDGMGRTRPAKHDPEVEVELCASLDQRFDHFWQELVHRKPDTLLASRTREILKWRFKDILSGNGWLLTCSRRGRLVGYAAFDWQCSHGLTRARTVDFQALPGHEPALVEPLLWMLRKCKQDRIGVIENPGCWLQLAGLPPLHNVRRRKIPAWSFYYKAVNETLREELSDPRVWAPSLLDGDVV